MAKIYGLFGSMTGKLADVVMAVRNGEQIARKYQPVVYNPNTPAQVAVRARLKLMSQISAVMSNVIAIPRQGSVSSRNIFVKDNFRTSTYDQTTNQADITLTAIKLTRGVLSFPVPTVTRETSNRTVTLPLVHLAGFSRVVMAVFVKEYDGSLRFQTSQVANVPTTGQELTLTYRTGVTGSHDVIYMYGVRDNTEAARVTFGNIQTLSAETVAKLIVTRTLLESDVTLSETVAVESNPVENANVERKTRSAAKD